MYYVSALLVIIIVTSTSSSNSVENTAEKTFLVENKRLQG